MFNEIEKEHGGGLKEQAGTLLKADSSDFHKALSGFMKASGSSKDIEPV